MSEESLDQPKKKRGRPPLDPEERERRQREAKKKYRYSSTNPAPAKRAERKLTPKQERFVRELVSKDGFITISEAAINAGYSPRNAASEASRMLNPDIYPHVAKRYQEYRQELEEKYAVSYKRHVRDLQTIRDKAMEAGAWSAAVQAEYRRGQAHGDIYISKSEVRHGSIDQMSKEEVLKALEELRGGGEIIDITPETEESDHGSGALGRVQEAIEGEISESVDDED